MIVKEKENLKKTYDRDIGVKYIELFEMSENSVSYQMMDLLGKFYTGHFPFEYHVRSFYIGTQQLFDKLAGRYLAMEDLFDRLAKNYDEMILMIAKVDEQESSKKEKKAEIIEEISEERQKELIDKINATKTRGEQLNLISRNSRMLHDVNHSDQVWISRYLTHNRLWMTTRGTKKYDESKKDIKPDDSKQEKGTNPS